MIKYVTKLKFPVWVVKGLKGVYALSSVEGRLQAVSWPGLQQWGWNPIRKIWEETEQPSTK